MASSDALVDRKQCLRISCLSMLDQATLTAGLERLRGRLEPDITERAEEEASISADLRQRYEAARAAKRTGLSFELWRAGEVTQAAVAWLLACVFVRFIEDNQLIEQPWISGPDNRLAAAKEQNVNVRKGRRMTDRDYLLHCFDEICKLPGVSALFDKEHNPLFRLSPTGHGARAIIDFFQKVDDHGQLVYDFTGTIDNTRFLGDLYQNISESARKRYALVQTPNFVVDFILDRTMDPALQDFGLDGFRIIDPACGSGHFLIAAFERLFHRWMKRLPPMDPIDCASRALASVYGIDLNPFAIAIARFRLLIDALRKCGVTRLSEAPNFQTNLAVGDSLLHGTRPRDAGRGVQSHAFDTSTDFYYATEDAQKLRDYLSGRYHAVVANPPYITVHDRVLREQYRDRFGSASGKYQLGVPFMERCFDLAEYGKRPGSIGIITSNAFMKRSFGRVLIEKYLPTWDVTHVIDTSGAFIPGHATPTVILLGRGCSGSANRVRVVRGIRGELREPTDPAHASVWTAIAAQVDEPGSQSRWVSVADIDRKVLYQHPWSMGGGGAAELKEQIDEISSTVLRNIVDEMGIFGLTAADDVMIAQVSDFVRKGVGQELREKISSGDDVRDWCVQPSATALFPYTTQLMAIDQNPKLLQWLWPYRTTLWARATFNGGTYRGEGRPWWQWHQVSLSRRSPNLIALAEIATHNHFALSRGCGVFKQTAPVIKLPSAASESDYIGMLGLLNSSTAGFWLRQVCYDKGSGGNGRGISTEQWEHQHAYDSTKVGQLPLSPDRPNELAGAIQTAAENRAKLAADLKLTTPSPKRFTNARDSARRLLGRMIALQEELDWNVYQLYNLTKESITIPVDQIPEIELGERAFEIVMARQITEGELETEWFNRHGSTPITEIPTHWPEPYRQLVQRRIDTIASDRDIALIEQPEYKRRWNLQKWEDLETEALRNWLLERLESARYWPTDPPMLRTVSNFASAAADDADFVQVAELYTGRADFKLDTLVAQLVEEQSVAFLPILRYKGLGIDKRQQWEATWALQRREDERETVSVDIPPKYERTEYLTDAGWRLRGKLDVPKERWISYPYLNRVSDSSLLIGWAGYDHAQQAFALAAYYQRMKEDGSAPSRLVPALAGILDLLPWVRQWHNEPDRATGTKAGDFLEEFLRNEVSSLNLTDEDLRNWTPPVPQKAPRASRAAKEKRS